MAYHHIVVIRKRNRQYVQDSKTGKACTDCGVIYPHYVMEYDHLRDKSYNVSEMGNQSWSLARIQEEIDKCELVCSNCHAARTWLRSMSL